MYQFSIHEGGSWGGAQIVMDVIFESTLPAGVVAATAAAGRAVVVGVAEDLLHHVQPPPQRRHRVVRDRRCSAGE